MNNKQIAQTIMQQMHYGYDQKIMLMSWGFNSPTIINNGIRFKVKGQLHRGYVEVTLNGSDLYDVRGFHTWGKKGIIEDFTMKDIYFDVLVETLDCYIETPE